MQNLIEKVSGWLESQGPPPDRLVLPALIVLALRGFFFFSGVRRSRALETCTGRTTAYINSIFHSKTPKASFEYWVNGKKYTGSTTVSCSFFWSRKSGFLSNSVTFREEERPTFTVCCDGGKPQRYVVPDSALE